jgi:filamentous hemagglutinin family protein
MKTHACFNRFYRLRWSEALCAWVCVAETSPARGKPAARRRAAVALAALAMLSPLAQAGPTGGQVQAGQGSITGVGNTTTIQQTSPTLSLKWQSFNVAPQETVSFVQPSAAAIAVNRIADTNGSQILGHLNANGQVWLVNPNGVLFGPSAQVDVGGLVASTLDVSDTAPGRTSFAGAGRGSVVNQGSIHAADGGYVALLGNRVSNQWVISARLGTVALGAGSALTLTFDGNQLLRMQVDRSTLNALAENLQLIHADGGHVFMTAGARDSLLASAVNNTGVIEARTVQEHEGGIVLRGGMQAGTVHVGGTLDASAPPGGNGGFIETSAAHVKVADGAKVTTAAPQGRTGTWLIDPQDFTIAASGGDITGADLSTSLSSTDVTLSSSGGATAGNGDIFVNDAVTWTASTILALSAQRNIYINAPIDASGSISGKVALQFGQGAVAAGNTSGYYVRAPISLPAGQNFSTQLGSDGIPQVYTVITSLGAPGSTTCSSSATVCDLQGIQGNRAGHYALGSNIDASATSGWNGGSGFAPIGALGGFTTSFNGTFDGLGHTITGLTINVSAAPGMALGLFGYASSVASLRNVGLVDESVSASFTGNGGCPCIGGLVGLSSGSVYNAYSTGTVRGDSNSTAGGLVGWSSGSEASSFSRATVSGNYAGGLVGSNVGSIADAYATGSVSGFQSSGGLTAVNYNGGGAITRSYSVGAVTGPGAGGLVAANLGTVTNSFWNTTASGQNTSDAGVGLTTAQMQTKANFTSATTANGNTNPAWDAAGTWIVYDGQTYPLLRSFLRPIAVTASGTKVYDGTSAASSPTYTWSDTPNAALLGSLTVSGIGRNVGTYTVTPGGVYSDQITSAGAQGYAIDFVNGTYTVTSRPLTGSISTGTSTYGAPLAAGTVTLNNIIAGDNVTPAVVSVNTAGLTSSSGHLIVGTHNGVQSVSGVLGGADAGNYTFAGATGDYIVSPASLAIANAIAADKTYDGAVNATVSGGNLTGVLSGDAVTLNTGGVSGAFADKNVGPGKAVTVSGYTISGTDAGNYTLAPTGLTASITPAALTISAVSDKRRYDGTTSSSATPTMTGTLYGSDSINGLTQAYASKNVLGTGGSTLSVSGYTVNDGNGGANYAVTTRSATGTITAAPLTIGATSDSRVYNGTTDSSATPIVSGLQSGDSVSGASQAYASKNVLGTGGSTLNVSGYTVSDGNGGTNYAVSTQSATGTITPAPLTIAAISDNRTYNGTTSSSGTPTVAGTVYGSDTVSSLSQAYASKNALGTGGSTLNVSGHSISDGNGGSNYAVTTQSATGTITPAPLTITAVSDSRVYNGTTSSSSTPTVAGTLYGTDSINGPTQAYASKDVLGPGGSTLNVSGYTIIDGNGGANYAVSTQTATGTITPAPLTLTAGSTAAANRTYNGTSDASVGGGTLSGVIGSDNVWLQQYGSFPDKNVGTGRTVSYISLLAGTEAGNYTLSNGSGSTSANIIAANLTVSGSTAADKTYDATTAAKVSGGSLQGIIPGDSVSLQQAGSFADKNVGSGKTVTVTNTLGGTDAGNYVVADTTTAANITVATLTVSGTTAANKTYDATTAATVSGGTLQGIIAGDSVSLQQAGSFDNKNVGTGKSVTVTVTNTLGGTDAGNYVVADTTSAANISAATITVTGTTAASKTYDATTAAKVSGGSLVGVIPGDTVTLNTSAMSGSFADKNVGTGKAVTVVGATLAGTDSGNYTLTQPAGLTADITPATLTYTATPSTLRLGDPLAGFSGTLTGFAAGDALASATAGGLTWGTNAPSSDQAGRFAITGSGLAATNYRFVQAESNATALTLVPVEAAQPVSAIVAQLQSQVKAPIPDAPRAVATQVEDRLQRTLRIIDGGVRLPDNTVQPRPQ